MWASSIDVLKGRIYSKLIPHAAFHIMSCVKDLIFFPSECKRAGYNAELYHRSPIYLCRVYIVQMRVIINISLNVEILHPPFCFCSYCKTKMGKMFLQNHCIFGKIFCLCHAERAKSRLSFAESGRFALDRCTPVIKLDNFHFLIIQQIELSNIAIYPLLVYKPLYSTAPRIAEKDNDIITSTTSL